MALNLANFVRTSLRAPIGPVDNVLQLAAGTGPLFNFPAGDYCYITLEDRMNHEIVRFQSVGPVVGDNISVQRAQDGTFARAFPAGTAVKVAWNEQQVKDLISATFTTLVSSVCPPANTIVVSAVPVGPPASCVLYAVNQTTNPWTMYYWDGTVWHPLNGTVCTNISYITNTRAWQMPLIVPTSSGGGLSPSIVVRGVSGTVFTLKLSGWSNVVALGGAGPSTPPVKFGPLIQGPFTIPGTGEFTAGGGDPLTAGTVLDTVWQIIECPGHSTRTTVNTP